MAAGPATPALGAGAGTARTGGPGAMSSHPCWLGSEPRALLSRAGALGQSALGISEGRAAGLASGTSDAGRHTLRWPRPRELWKGAAGVWEVGRQRPLVPAADPAGRPHRALKGGPQEAPAPQDQWPPCVSPRWLPCLQASCPDPYVTACGHSSYFQ